MTDDWDAADEDWYDDEDADDQFDEEPAVRCPECGGSVYSATDKCPACGYWLSEADRRGQPGASKPRWIQLTAGLILLALLGFEPIRRARHRSRPGAKACAPSWRAS